MTIKYLEFDSNLKLAEMEEALGRAHGLEDCAAWANGQYPIPPYQAQNDPPAPYEYQYFFAFRPRLFTNPEGSGGVLKLFSDCDYENALRVATAHPTHTLSNGATYTIDLSGAKDWEDLSPAGKALFPEDEPPPEE